MVIFSKKVLFIYLVMLKLLLNSCLIALCSLLGAQTLEPFYESNNGESITIVATPAGDPPSTFTYQWYFNGFAIPDMFGGNSPAYTIDGASTSDGAWRVDVTNDTGTTSSTFEYRVFSDADSDSLSDYRETAILGTNPNLADTDGDGLDDLSEVNTHPTDPKLSDTDSDGLGDGAEINTYSTDPNVDDTDGDGLLDGDEVITHLTDPLLDDTVGDGFTDGFLVTQGKDPLVDYSDIRSETARQSQDSESGNIVLQVINNGATVQLKLEESSDLVSWTETGDAATIVVPADADTRFFRFNTTD